MDEQSPYKLLTRTEMCHHKPCSPFNSKNTNKAKGVGAQSVKRFIKETSPAERSTLRKELCLALLHFISMNKPVYLEGLGILIPVTSTKEVCRSIDSKLMLRKETIKDIVFEKCYDLVSFHRTRFNNILETKDLVERIYPRLSLALQLNWSKKRLSAYVRGLIKTIRDEVIVDGYSRQLSPLGDLFSLHNRQGKNIEDWFAGADVFLHSSFRETLLVGSSKVFSRPVLENAWELFEAAYGPACHSFSIDLSKELSKLGYDTSAFHAATKPKERKVPVAVFKVPQEHDGKNYALLYCTNGLRSLANTDSANSIANEFVFQLAPEEIKDSAKTSAIVPEWPARPLTMAWIIMQSTKSKTVKQGAQLSCGLSLCEEDVEINFKDVFLTEFSLIKTPQQSKEGLFSYMNIVGITEDEAKVAELYSSKHLATLLAFKHYDQITKPQRSSIIAKTGLLANP